MYHIFRDSSLALVESTLQLFERRISILGKGVKDYFFLSMVSSFVRAKESPELSERYMRQSADRCARVYTALSLQDLAGVSSSVVCRSFRMVVAVVETDAEGLHI